MWHAAARGEPVDWEALMDGYAAAVDWPAGAFWQELSAAFPDALILLSTRDSAEEWWRSASNTIFLGIGRVPPDEDEEQRAWRAMVFEMARARFTADIGDRDAAMAAYERHNAEVRATAPPDRLLDWRPSDGWGPICDALGLPVPDEPFPLTNTTAEFRERAGFDRD